MSILSTLWHARRYKNLWDAWNRLKKNWRNPEMNARWLQRECLLPILYSVLRAANEVYALGLTEKTIDAIGISVAGIIVGLLVRKKIMKEGEGRK